MRKNRLHFRSLYLALPAFCVGLGSAPSHARPNDGELLPTGQRITPTAAPGSVFRTLNPGLSSDPDFLAGQAVSSAVSPDGKTLMVLTSGFNRLSDADGTAIPEASNEYVFVYDISRGEPVQKQVLQVPNSFVGLAFAPNGKSIVVSGGVDDTVHVFALGASGWAESGAPIALGHGGVGNGLWQNVLGVGSSVTPVAAGVAFSADGRKLVVANYENDSISVIDVASRSKVGELDLRPGKRDPAASGTAGGEFPYAVVIRGNQTAYVSSLRDREIVVVDVRSAPRVVGRIPLAGNPGKMLLDRTGARLFVASDNSDTVDVIDTRTERVVRRLQTTAPPGWFGDRKAPVGSSPNGLALSPDERTLYVTNAGSNSVAVLDLGHAGGTVTGLIPTGWYPNSVSLSADGRRLYVANGKSNAGPNPAQCAGTSANATLASNCPASAQDGGDNEYVWQLTKAGLASIPVPGRHALAELTDTVAANNGFARPTPHSERELLRGLRERIHHVIYIVKENRTYDQILGDLPGSNGDPTLTQFPELITPNFHALARQFVNLDNFHCSGEVSQDGWQWSTAARSSDINDKSTPVGYAGRGTGYDSEGSMRDINPAFATSAERQKYNPNNPGDPDLLPGHRNEVELDGPDGEEGGGYIWSAALRAGKSVRNYGFWVDGILYNQTEALHGIPAIRDPHAEGVQVGIATQAELLPLTDPYFRGFGNELPDLYRFREWEREFDAYAAEGTLPDFELVRFPNDHMGNFDIALDGVNTPETQQADNDYGVGLLVDKIAHSRYADDTLIFVLEDDAQDGPDHVDAHRSPAYVVGPYVKHGAIVSTHYTTVNMLRTIEDVLGLEHLNLHDSGVHAMSDVFDLDQRKWSFGAQPSVALRTTALPLPPAASTTALNWKPTHPAAWWAQATLGFDFRKEDRIDAAAFNRVLWKGLMGERPYPVRRPKAARHAGTASR
jgi:YVTN family beta-propeller protein